MSAPSPAEVAAALDAQAPPAPTPAHANVHAAVAAVMGEVGYVHKGGRVDGRDGGYSFAGESDVLRALRPAMVRHGLTIHVRRYSHVVYGSYPTKAGNAMHTCSLRAHGLLVHAPSGTSFDIQAEGFGADVGDKHPNKAMTVAFKYLLRQTFALETGDDPDRDASVEEASPTAPQERAQAPAGASGRPAPGNAPGGQPGGQAGASGPVPPCDQCGGPGEANPFHARNEKAPEFRCAGSCEETGKDGKTYRHGISRATEAQVKAASTGISALEQAIKARLPAGVEPMVAIRRWLVRFGVPDTRRAWSRDHASKVLDALKGADFVAEDIVAAEAV